MTKLKAMRIKRGYSQMYICQAVNNIGEGKGKMSPSALSKYELKKRGLSVKTLQDFCKFYGCTMEELIGESDE